MNRANVEAMRRVRRTGDDRPLTTGGPRATGEMVAGETWSWVTDGHFLVFARGSASGVPDGAEFWYSVMKFANEKPGGVAIKMGRLREFAGTVTWPATKRTQDCDECDGKGKHTYDVGKAPNLTRTTTKCEDCDGHGKIVPHESPVCVRMGAAVVNRLIFARALACVVADDDEAVRVRAAHELDAVEVYGDGFRLFVMPMRAEGFEIAATLEELAPPHAPARRTRVSP